MDGKAWSFGACVESLVQPVLRFCLLLELLQSAHCDFGEEDKRARRKGDMPR